MPSTDQRTGKIAVPNLEFTLIHTFSTLRVVIHRRHVQLEPIAAFQWRGWRDAGVVAVAPVTVDVRITVTDG